MSDYLLHGGTLALAWFLLVNIVATGCVAAWARREVARGSESLPDRRPAAFWFAARLTPACAAALFVGGVFLPSYWKYEPREFVEGFDVTLTAFGAAALVLVAGAAARAVIAWRRATGRTHQWIATARPIALNGAAMPAFEIDVDAPMMALVGVLRPRLIVTRGLIAALTREELAASIAHEVGHSRAWDNLKRLMMRAAPDLLPFIGAAGPLERRWASASEHRADSVAAEKGGPTARCALASALVKVARLMAITTSVCPTGEPISTLVDGGEIASRVRRLLADPVIVAHRPALAIQWPSFVVMIVATTAIYPPVLKLIHSATELLVRSLP